mgnify:CR=1 FL=1
MHQADRPVYGGHLQGQLAPVRHLQWIKASVGSTVRLIPVEQVLYVKSDNKYTMVVWEGGEALIRKTIRELADELPCAGSAQRALRFIAGQRAEPEDRDDLVEARRVRNTAESCHRAADPLLDRSADGLRYLRVLVLRSGPRVQARDEHHSLAQRHRVGSSRRRRLRSVDG